MSDEYTGTQQMMRISAAHEVLALSTVHEERFFFFPGDADVLPTCHHRIGCAVSMRCLSGVVRSVACRYAHSNDLLRTRNPRPRSLVVEEGARVVCRCQEDVTVHHFHRRDRRNRLLSAAPR